jgi:hypothetical protein
LRVRGGCEEVRCRGALFGHVSPPGPSIRTAASRSSGRPRARSSPATGRAPDRLGAVVRDHASTDPPPFGHRPAPRSRYPPSKVPRCRRRREPRRRSGSFWCATRSAPRSCGGRPPRPLARAVLRYRGARRPFTAATRSVDGCRGAPSLSSRAKAARRSTIRRPAPLRSARGRWRRRAWASGRSAADRSVGETPWTGCRCPTGRTSSGG